MDYPITTLFVLPTLAYGLYIAYLLDAFKAVDNNLICKTHGADVMPNTEDFAQYKNGIIFVSSGDIATLFENGLAATQEGEIYAVDLSTADGMNIAPPTLVPREGYPSSRRFQPHGIYYSNSTNRLYAVSHAWQGSGSFVEIFEVEEQPFRLKYVDSLRPTGTENGVINDVVEMSKDEIFVTRFWMHTRPLHPKGEISNQDSWDQFMAENAKMMIRSDYVIRCKRKPSDVVDTDVDVDVDDYVADTWNCTKASEVMGMLYNGITMDKDKKHLFVVDTLEKLIRVFNVSEDGLGHVRDIASPHALDNIDCDEATGDLTAGSVSLMWAHMWKLKVDPKGYVPGGLLRFRGTPEGGYSVAEDDLHDGSQLSMISTGVAWGDTIVLGSWHEPGFAACVRAPATVA